MLQTSFHIVYYKIFVLKVYTIAPGKLFSAFNNLRQDLVEAGLVISKKRKIDDRGNEAHESESQGTKNYYLCKL